jgi:tripartite ATP-independent transporter DctP family solute receptor
MLKPVTKLVSALVIGSLAATLLVGCGGEQKAADSQKKMVLKYGELNPDNHPMTVAANKFAEIVKTKSNGRIEVQVYPSGQLGDEKTEIQGVQMGAIDFCRANTISLGDYGVKQMNLFALPFVFRDRDHIWKVLDSDIGKDMLDTVQKSGTKMVGIGWMEEGARSFFFRDKEVKSIADLKGLKIRVPQTQIMMDTVAAFGASPTPISYSELYSSLQTGVVDGAENPPTGYVANNFNEVAKYYSLNNHVYSPSVICISEATWSKLSPEDQKLMKDAMKEVEKFNRETSEKADKEAMEQAKKKGAVITDIPDKTEWQNAVKPLYEKYGADFKDLLAKIINTK